MEEILANAEDIVVIQADNPDGDSLASALALEHILTDQGKTVHLYCGAVIPSYLRYMQGWDRVQDSLPVKFGASIIVDTSALTLLEQLQKSESLGWVKAKPCIILDHHVEAEPTIDFADIIHIKPAVSTGELIYELAGALKWQLNLASNEFIMYSIMSDSLGLTTDGTTARSIEIVSELVKNGVSIPKLENARRVLQKKSPEILAYKAELLKRVEYGADGRIATVTIPWEEIEKHSHQYNPPMLVIDEMRMVENVQLAIAFKTYPDGKITGKLRSNYGYGICAQLAEHFGGGGHPYAAGFKVTGGKPFNQLKSECIKQAAALLDTLKKDTDDENTQYAYTVG